MSMPQAPEVSRRLPWPVLLAVAVGLTLTLVAFWSVRSANEARLVLRFTDVVGVMEREARRDLERDLEVIYSLRDAYHIEGGLTRDAFRVFAAGQLRRHPDLLALEWVPVVRAEERAAYEERARREGFEGFRLTERGPDGTLVPAGDRDVYYPVYYVEPLAGNEAALGYAPVLPPRDVAIALARDTGGPAASQGFEIVQPPPGRVGVAMFVPVYRTPTTPATVAERREALVGLMEGVVLPSVMLAPLVEEARTLGIAVALTDASAPPGEQVLVAAAMPVDDRMRRREARIPMGTREWVLAFTLADDRVLRGTGHPEWLVLVGGLAGTALLGGSLQLMYERRRHAELLLGEKTRALAQARALEAMKNNFVSAVSHDLRTPLTSIRGYAEFLEDEIGGPLSPSQQGFVAQIARSAQRLGLLVDDLLDHARLDAGTFVLRREPADLAQLAREVGESLGPLVEEAGLTLSLPGEEAATAEMDAARIERVLFNLLHNAVKFTPRGGAIAVRVTEEPGLVRCEVADTGEGIAEDQQARLFERFIQLKGGTEKGGTGLGLSIAKAIIEAHGGAIGVESAPGQGATFWFTLPAAVA